jgi:hypothetical protein
VFYHDDCENDDDTDILVFAELWSSNNRYQANKVVPSLVKALSHDDILGRGRGFFLICAFCVCE